MTAHDLLVLVTLLSPGLLLSIIIMATFAAGGWCLENEKMGRWGE